jgi:S-DNA-T family DNA segregation ATPase FtsK/SpoIIIE
MDAELTARALALLHRGVREVSAIFVAVVAVLMLLSLLTFHGNDPGWSHTGSGGVVNNACGILGAWFADITMFLFGYVAYLLPVAIGWLGWIAFRDERSVSAPVLLFARVTGAALLIATACGLADLHFFVHRGDLPIGAGGGGVLGTWLAGNMVRVVNTLGSTLLLLTLFLASVTFMTGVSWFRIVEQTGTYTLKAAMWLRGASVDLMQRIRDYIEYREARRQRARQLLNKRQEELEREALGQPEKQAALVKPRVEIVPPEPAADTPPLKAAKAQPVPAKPESAPPAPAAPVEKASGPIVVPPPAPPEAAPVVEEGGDALSALNNAMRVQSEIPPVNLLDAIAQVQSGYSEESLQQLSTLLETKLAEFNITVEVVAVHPGPVITRFEVLPAPGLKVSKITNISKDIARSLSVMSVRVVEVIAGKSTIGLEIPNDDREIVQLTEILQSAKYAQTKSPLAIALGKDISGMPVVADLARMPHLLVAGTTGSGKSVAVNSMLISLLYKATADQVRLILIDPKMLELNVYEGIPHLLAPVVTDMKEAANALRWCVGEMERRYRLMAALGVRNIGGFNKKVNDAIESGEPIVDPLYKPEEAFDPSAPPPTLEPLPFIVVVVDEFADMMMVVGKKVEELIARIAQKARAAGIHLVLATQRPSVDVITGLIKANIPTRMAFQVSSKIDSRTILDQGGAEALLGHGDMLYLPPGTAHPERVHGAFVDDHEVHSVVAWLKESGTAVYVDEILEESTTPLPGLASENTDEGGEKDALYDQAVAIVTESRKASISYVQRRLKIGYNRAARMVEEMEAAGVVSAVQHNGSREVLAPPPV